MAQTETPNPTIDVEANDQVPSQQDPVQATILEMVTPPVATKPKSQENVKAGSKTHHEERIEAPKVEQTQLHALIETTEDDEAGLVALKENLDSWKEHINTFAPNKLQESALHMLVTKGFYNMAKYLIDNKANVCAEDSEGAQPLHLACKGGNVELVRILLRKGAPIDHLDIDGYLPLHWASRYGCDAVIPELLGPETAFLNQKETASEQTPLNMACYHDQRNVVKMLLKQKKVDLHLEDMDGWTPFLTAISEGKYEILQILMDHSQTVGGKQFDIPNNEGRTPLMQLCANASENKRTFQRDKEFIDALLKLDPNVNAKDDEKRTALHFAIESAITAQDTSVPLTIIKHVPNDLLLVRDSDGATPFDIAFNEDGTVEVLRPVLDTLIGRLKPSDTDIEDLNKDLLYWMIDDDQRHALARQILSALPAAKKVPDKLNPSSWQLIEWIINYRLESPLLHYISRRSYVHGSDADISKSDAKRGKDLLQKLRELAEKLPSRNVDKGKKDVPASHHTDRKGQDRGIKNIRDMEELLDLWFFKSPVKRVESFKLHKADENMSKALLEVQASVLQNYETSTTSGNVYRFRSLKDIVYEPDAIETYTETFDRIRNKIYKPKDVSSAAAEESDAEIAEKAEFTWVHLPSPNIDWMENITRKILKRENHGEDQDQGILSFFRDSWVQIPDQTSSSRFMRPRYVERKKLDDNMGDTDSNTSDSYEEEIHDSGSQTAAASPTCLGDAQEDEQDDDRSSNNSATEQGSTSDRSSEAAYRFVGASALYVSRFGDDFCQCIDEGFKMPFLELSIYHRNEDKVSSTEDQIRSAAVRPRDETKILEDLEKRKSLLNAYKDSPFHGPSTLDEFYYHFTDDSNEEKRMRNQTQVLTKHLYPEGVEDRTYWPLVRVDQLWIWIIDDKWLISCSSSTTNEENDDLMTNVLKYLDNEVESGSCHSQPTSANDMSRAIADYCIYTYEKKRKGEDLSDKHTRTEPEENTGSGEGTMKQRTFDGDKDVTSEQRAGRKQRSIRQVYSDYVNEIGKKESKLFSVFSDREQQYKETGHRSFTMEELDRALGEGATQLHRIKDVRDELNILKTIAKYQLAVRSKMAGETREKEDLMASYVLGDIIELENNAKQMQDAFISTISLQESELANFQAQQAVKQGKTVMVFTVVTVWFLPLSFLTSLFALDVSSFLPAPAWALVIVFTVPLLFLAAAGVYMYYADKGSPDQTIGQSHGRLQPI
ncbi:hypothetical protein ACHAP5_008571 [Fusarium lateritium]